MLKANIQLLVKIAYFFRTFDFLMKNSNKGTDNMETSVKRKMLALKSLMPLNKLDFIFVQYT